MAGVFNEDAHEKIDAALKMVTELWWGTRTNSLARIRQFLTDRFDELQPGRPDLNCDAVAFVDDDITVIPINVLNRELGDDATRILDELAGLGALKTEQPGRRVHRFCNNRFRGYAIFTKRIWPNEALIAA